MVADGPRRPFGLSALSRRASLAPGLALVTLLGGCAPHEIVRLVDGAPVPHRAISTRAYAAYARGAVAEATGALTVALAEYRTAAEVDSRGVEPWVREASVACALGRYDVADEAFAQAKERDSAYEPLWTEEARCELAHGDPKRATELAARAESLDPESDDAVETHAAALERAGEQESAIRELVALSERRPTPTTYRALLALAKRANDAPVIRVAERAFGRVEALPKEGPFDLAGLDRLLERGDIADALREGRRIGQSPSDVSVRAAALGRYAVAREIAEPIVRADPRDADALIAVLASRASSGPDRIDELLSIAAAHVHGGASELARLVMWEALYRRVGPDALEGVTFGPLGEDDLARALSARLESHRPSK